MGDWSSWGTITGKWAEADKNGTGNGKGNQSDYEAKLQEIRET
ncbi:hypothetical protein [Virgibacillus ainsalahensis]